MRQQENIEYLQDIYIKLGFGLGIIILIFKLKKND